jgi:soluble lytic murein transglycosylase-like protein
MSLPVKSVASGVGGNTDLEQLRRGNGTVETEKARLRKATKEFESYFVYQMLKTMRQTVPDGSQSESNVLSEGLGKDTFTDIFDMEIARKASFGGHNSISELMYRSMEKLVDTKFAQKPDQVTIKPLNSAETVVLQPLQTKKLTPLPRPSDTPVPLERTPETVRSAPVRRPAMATPTVSTASESQSVKVDKKAVTQPEISSHDPIRARFGHIIDRVARETNLDSALISSVIRAESSGDPQAVSPTGAKGLMQLADSTAQELEVSDPFDPDENIRAGSRYLRRMLDRFGDLELALAAYNAGPGNVAKYDGVPPFAETRNYVKKVTDALEANPDK